MVQIPNSDLSTTKSYVQEHQVVPAKAWSFYAFNVTEQDYQIVVNLAAEEDSQCEGDCLPVAQPRCVGWAREATHNVSSSKHVHCFSVLCQRPSTESSDGLVVCCWPLSTLTV